MGRLVMLGNGSLTVGLNESGLVHDFYYPYVGLDNLTTARSMDHKIGVWVDGVFIWVDDGSWNITVDFEKDSLVSNVQMTHARLQVELKFADFIDYEFNAFCRQVTVINHADHERNIRIFMHQVFQISRGGRADTALFVPEDNYLLDYKGRCSLLIYGQHTASTKVFDQFSVGNYGIEGKEGTYRDAEDGELSGNAVEHGGVDSVLRYSCELSANGEEQLDYWIVAADSQFTAEKIHQRILGESLKTRLQKTRDHWYAWLDIGRNGMQNMSEQERVMVRKSLMVIKAHCDKRGGIIASCDSSIYNYGRDYYTYVWPRDAAYAIWPLIRLGYKEEPQKFFEFCRDILTDDGYLMHKYQPDKAIGSTWHPLLHGRHKELAIQEDETAIVICMLGEYVVHKGDKDFVQSLYATLIQPASNFMAEFIDPNINLPHASYDLWEEKFMTTTYTTAVVYQALLTAATFADMFEYPDDAVKWRAAAHNMAEGARVLLFDKSRNAFRRGYLLKEDGALEFDNTLDVSSMYGVFMFALHDFGLEETKQTVAAIEQTLLNQSPAGGSPRYEHDMYFASNPAYMGNPWFVTTLWLAQYYVRANNPEKAQEIVDWTMKYAQSSGVLSEQINPSTGVGISVMPLVWSHAELINVLLDLNESKS